MPSGAKKRRALKKKKQQEAIGTITKNQGINGDNLHGTEEHGSQDGRGSDSSLSSPGSQRNEEFGAKGTEEHGSQDRRGSDSSLSSPGSQRNEEFGAKGTEEHGSQDRRESDSSLSSPRSQGNEEFGAKVSSPSLSSDMVKDAAKEISGDTGIGPQSGNAVTVEIGTNFQKNIVGKSTNSSSENSTHPAKNGACGNSVAEITPVVDSVKPVLSLPKAVISEKSEHVKKKSEENEEHHLSPGLGNKDSKVDTLPKSAAETSKKEESVTKSEVAVSSEENRLLLPGPPVVRRTSWLSCCGLFDAMTGSDR